MLEQLPFGPAPEYRIEINPFFDESLESAIDLFNEKRAEALTTLYTSEAITCARSMEGAADVEEMAASCGYFSYNLTFFAEEMKTFLDILEELQRLQETKEKSWEWLKFWKRLGRKKVQRASEEGNAFSPLSRVTSKLTRPYAQRHFSAPQTWTLDRPCRGGLPFQMSSCHLKQRSQFHTGFGRHCVCYGRIKSNSA
jgi:hypothetical protein